MKRTPFRPQLGISLVELLVGVAIGLLVILAAIGTLVISRAASGTVSDATQLQHQGSYALRVIGLQLRQAGAIDADYDEASQLFAFSADYEGLATTGAAVDGAEGANGGPDTLVVSTSVAGMLQQRDCLGAEVDETAPAVEAEFSVVDGSLRCQAANTAQPIVRNVADFQVRYRTVTSQGARMLDRNQVQAAALWKSVVGVEVCLDLVGEEPVPDAGITYVNCAGEAAARGARQHMVFRNLFHLRAQGASA